MKKTFFLAVVLILLLTACGSNSQPTLQAGTGTGFDPNSRELPLSTKLAIGTLKLEGTDNAVTSDQAAELLPLWQVYSNLSSKDTAAPEEVTALTEQIQGTMTQAQLQAIDNMNLTGQDIFATMQELGLANAPQVNASGTPQAGGGFGNGQRPSGNFQGPPDGGFSGGGGQGRNFGGQGFSPEQLATAQARRSQNGGGFGNRMMTPLVEAVVKLLESKTDS